MGPSASFSLSVTYAVRAGSSGCRKACSSAANPSRRNSVQEVTDQTSAATLQS